MAFPRLSPSRLPLRWIAIPNIAVLIVTLQALGALMVHADPAWFGRLALFPEAVWAGQLWRVLTFLALPVTLSPLWLLIALWFTYFIVNAIESVWGSYRTTLYVLLSPLTTVIASLALNVPVLSATDFESSLFLAAAALFPNMEVRLFFVLPVKMKWLGYLALAFLVLRLFQLGWSERALVISAYSNYLIFFGPQVVNTGRNAYRRWQFRRKLRG